MNKKIKAAMHKHMMELYKQEGYAPPSVDSVKSYVEKEHGQLLTDGKMYKTPKKPRRALRIAAVIMIVMVAFILINYPADASIINAIVRIIGLQPKQTAPIEYTISLDDAVITRVTETDDFRSIEYAIDGVSVVLSVFGSNAQIEAVSDNVIKTFDMFDVSLYRGKNLICYVCENAIYTKIPLPDCQIVLTSHSSSEELFQQILLSLEKAS